MVLCKSFKTKTQLRNFCKRDEIVLCNSTSIVCSYGLLGSSGCGKTTLLRCILGRLNLAHGEIVVLGKPPGSRGHQIPGKYVGYMPQVLPLSVHLLSDFRLKLHINNVYLSISQLKNYVVDCNVKKNKSSAFNFCKTHIIGNGFVWGFHNA